MYNETQTCWREVCKLLAGYMMINADCCYTFIIMCIIVQIIIKTNHVLCFILFRYYIFFFSSAFFHLDLLFYGLVLSLNLAQFWCLIVLTFVWNTRISYIWTLFTCWAMYWFFSLHLFVLLFSISSVGIKVLAKSSY